MNELRALRMRKDELETHLTTLQDSRRQLMIQLEGLMKMLKNHQASPRSTPNSSPRSTKSPPLLPGGAPAIQPPPRSAPQTPMSVQPPVNSVATQPERPTHMAHPIHNNDSLMGVGGDVRNAFGGGASVAMGGFVSL